MIKFQIQRKQEKPFPNLQFQIKRKKENQKQFKSMNKIKKYLRKKCNKEERKEKQEHQNNRKSYLRKKWYKEKRNFNNNFKCGSQVLKRIL